MKGALILVLLTAGACANDARLLYERTTSQEGGAGGKDVPPPPLGGAPEPTGGGGSGPPPPVICPPPEEPFCECPIGESCICEPEPGLPCDMNCPEGYCQMSCGSAETCDLFCSTGCFMVCPSGSDCTFTCGAGCDVICDTGSHCVVMPLEEDPTHVFCEPGASCECGLPDSCICEGEGCVPLP